MYKVLVADEIPDEAVYILTSSKKFEVTYNPAISADELKEEIDNVHALIVRSRTKVTRDIIERGKNLQVIARAGIGIDNIDVEEATRRGIYVVNSPEGNVVSAAEHTFALLLSLVRHIPQADRNVKNNLWKKDLPAGTELCGKTLGIIGLGKVGSKVANFALAFKMNVLVFDPYIKPEKFPHLKFTDLDTLLSSCDIITLHVPLNETTRNLIGKKEIRKMKKGSFLINTSRGEIIDENALCEALKENIISGAALDVFAKEPLIDHPLQKLPNVILTPHLGASTEEAQIKVAIDIAKKILDFYENGFIPNAVNLPLPRDSQCNNFVNLATIMGKILGQITRKNIENIQIKLYGEFESLYAELATRGVLAGLLQQIVDVNINIINAMLIAKEKGINTFAYIEKNNSYFKKLEITSTFYNELTSICGTVNNDGTARILNINGFEFDIKPEDNLLIITYKDLPGMVGKVGAILGNNNINIGKMEVSRKIKGDIAMLILTLDDPVSKGVIDEIKEAINPITLALINL
ncbi:MAG: phosphoglycerate dehydrogenase [Planctomycetota bacterium]